VALVPPKPTSINAVAIANDEFENLITYPFKIESENQFHAASLGSDSPRRKKRQPKPESCYSAKFCLAPELNHP
jgi:hypothetical protein